MDLNSLKEQVSNLTLYDLKAGVRKVQNAVMNYTELEAKVREATNNEPWGASTTLMQDIANGTYSYQGLNEIMPMLYKRFTEKTAEEWRQIYKALQLLEFLIKNGSERVVDDARGHLSLLKMLRQFQYHDQNGKDQGINVRNRAKELAELLSDVDKIRTERKKARANRNKYGGVEGGAGFSGGLSSGSRYGGFGSEETDSYGYGSQSRGVYGDGGGFGGQSAGDMVEPSSRGKAQYEEYDEGDDMGTRSAPRRTGGASSAAARKPAPPPKAKEPEEDLFDFGDEPIVSKPAAAPAPVMQQPAAAAAGGDDFDDFVSAEPQPATAPVATFSPPPQTTSNIGSSTTFAAPKPMTAAQPGTSAGNFSNIMANYSPALSGTLTPSMASTGGLVSPPPSQSTMSTGSFAPMQATNAMQAPKPTGFQPAQPNYFTSVKAGGPSSTSSTPAPGSGSTFASPSPLGGGGAAKPAGKASAGGDAFASLWGSASAGAGVKKTAPGPKLADMAKAQAQAGIWGAPAASSSTPRSTAAPVQSPPVVQTKPSVGGGLDDLLG